MSFLIQSDNLYIYIGMFRPFTVKVTINIALKSKLLLAILLCPICTILPFSFFLSWDRGFYDDISSLDLLVIPLFKIFFSNYPGIYNIHFR